MNTNPVWTKRATKRLRDAARYIAENFYPEYAIAFSNDVINTANLIGENPEIGPEAFPKQNIRNCRKLLCKNRRWWVFYKIKPDHVEIISVKHAMQNIQSPRNL